MEENYSVYFALQLELQGRKNVATSVRDGEN